MLGKLLIYLYRYLPSKFIIRIASSPYLAPVRNIILRPGGYFREVKVIVLRNYLSQSLKFFFYASPKVAEKARRKGIENILCRIGIQELTPRQGKAVVLDIGSNFGYLSLVWALTIAKKVLAFEPHPKVAQSFIKSIKENNLQDKIELQKKAVGKSIKKLKVQLSGQTLINGIGDRVITVEQISIDSLQLKQCDLIKIDVDGLEFDILEGAKLTIDQLRPILIVEYNNDKRILEFFQDRPYKLYNHAMREISTDDSLVNLIALPKETKKSNSFPTEE